MTSKISYSKLIRQSVRQRAWYCACMALVLFIFLPITAMLRFSGDVTALSAAQVTDTATALESMKASYRGLLAGGYPLTELAMGAERCWPHGQGSLIFIPPESWICFTAFR